MQLRNPPANPAKIFARKEILSPVLITTMSKNMDAQLKMAHKVVDVVDRANRKIYLKMLQYNVDKPESSHAQFQIIARRKEDEKFQQVVYVKNKIEEFIY